VATANLKIAALFLCLLAFLVVPVSRGAAALQAAQNCTTKAFPGAEGFGTETAAGRGGRIIYVTNLNDSGSGSLRAALEASGRRTVLFQVSGTIDLNEDIRIKQPFITIAGQSAPGEGVQIRGGQIHIETHDVLIRYLKVRSGDALDKSDIADRDAVTVNNPNQTYKVIIDHAALIWGPDVGGLTFLNGASDSTVSYSIIGEGLYISNHPEGTVLKDGHSMSLNITELDSSTPPTRITVHHNLITTSADRNPRVIGGVNIDLVNNVVYNWRYSSSQGNPRALNLINNLFIRGPMTNRETAFYAWMPSIEDGGRLHLNSVYEVGNQVEGFKTVRKPPPQVYVRTRFEPYSMQHEDTPLEAYRKIVEDAGANLQVAARWGTYRLGRDSVDQRLIDNLLRRTGDFVNGVDNDGMVGFRSISWPELKSGPAAVDIDLDGMPDGWERLYYGSILRGSPLTSGGDFDRDGYTDVEEYLNRTNPTVAGACP
jgi:pectate lyase